MAATEKVASRRAQSGAARVALGPELPFLGASLNARGLTSWFGAGFALVTGVGLFELCRRQFLQQWGESQEEIERELKRTEAM